MLHQLLLQGHAIRPTSATTWPQVIAGKDTQEVPGFVVLDLKLHVAEILRLMLHIS